jgi:hypothetical protein
MLTTSGSPAQWLLLVHQLPARPAYQRVKLRRRLQALGAVSVKKTDRASAPAQAPGRSCSRN